MIKNLTIGTLFLLFSSILTVPGANVARASEEPNDTRIEKYEDLTENETNTADSIPEDEPGEVSEDSLLEDEDNVEDVSEEDMSETDMSEIDASEENVDEVSEEDIEDPSTRTEEKLEEFNSEE